nr:hypothetical protein MarFTME_324 [Marseillevirus futianmevirus]
MTKSLILENVLLRLKEYVEEPEIQVTIEPIDTWTRFCLCYKKSKNHCKHGNILPDKGTVIIVKVNVKDWRRMTGDSDVLSLFWWRECLVDGEPLFLPLHFWESDKRQQVILKALFSSRKKELREYRKKKLEFLRDRVSTLEEENKALSLSNEKYSLLLEELYAPGGALAKDAMEHFSSLK